MFARIEGSTLFYDVVGSGLAVESEAMTERPVLVALHGGPGFDHSTFRPWLDGLSSSMQVVYLDQRGNGRSSRHEVREYTMARMARDVEALREHLGLQKIFLLGHSFGGKVAQEYARRHSSGLAALILVDTAPGAQFGNDAQAVTSRHATPEQFELMSALFEGEITTEQAWDHWVRTCMPLYFARPDPDVLEGIEKRGVGSFEIASHMMRHETPYFDMRPDLPFVSVPTLVIVGRHDWITPVGQSEEIAAAVPNARLEIFEDSGHMPFIEETEHFLHLVRAFVEEHRP